jgi:hypothetical protein
MLRSCHSWRNRATVIFDNPDVYVVASPDYYVPRVALFTLQICYGRAIGRQTANVSLSPMQVVCSAILAH